VHPGVTARDGRGDTWFLEFDPKYYPEGATGSLVMATKFFWALGYNQVETFLTTLDPKRVAFESKGDHQAPEWQTHTVHTR
jgi:hypothetical protein